MIAASPADRLFTASLLGLLLCGFLALAATGELPVWLLFGCLACFVLRVLRINPFGTEVPSALINAAVVLYAGFYAIDIYWISGEVLTPTVRLICFLTVAKALVFRDERDAFWSVVIAFMQLVAAALLSTSLLFFVFLVLFLVCGVTCFSAWEIRRGARDTRVSAHGLGRGFHRRTLTVSLAATAGIVLFTVALFFILPRTARAALQNFVSQRFHLPGYGGEVDLRKIGEIQTSSRTVMYVRFPGQPEQLQLFWRGSAMSKFDGKRWTTSGDLAEQVRVRHGAAGLPPRYHHGRQGVRAKYEVQLAETGMNALFIAGLPEYLEANLTSLAVLSNGSIRSIGEMPAVLRYSVTAFFDLYGGDGTPVLTREERRRLLELPLNADNRIVKLTQRVAGSENNPALQARRITEYLRTNYAYTLELPSEEQSNPTAHFLFERKKGHCEYFASSMALMLRSIGIPARVATGFRGGTLNPLSGWYTIRAADAHSWVEAFVPGNGWTAYDPTPATPASAQWPVISRFSQLIEAADLFWQDWVLQYDLDRQFRLASQIESSRLGTRGWSLRLAVDELAGWRLSLRSVTLRYRFALAAAVVAAGCAWFVLPWLLRRRRDRARRAKLESGQASASDATQLYERLLHRLEEHGIHKPAWFTPLEFARRLPPSELSAQIASFTHAYNSLRFGGDVSAATRMLTLYDAIDQRLHHSATEPSS